MMDYAFLDCDGRTRFTSKCENVNEFVSELKERFLCGGTIREYSDETFAVYDYFGGEAELKYEKYLDEVCDSYAESKTEIPRLKNQIAELAHAVLLLSRNKEATPKGIQLTKRSFVEVLKACDKESCASDTEVDYYDHDVTMHWHGLYVNFGDGTLVCNELLNTEFIADFVNEEENCFKEYFNTDTCKVDIR